MQTESSENLIDVRNINAARQQLYHHMVIQAVPKVFTKAAGFFQCLQRNEGALLRPAEVICFPKTHKIPKGLAAGFRNSKRHGLFEMLGVTSDNASGPLQPL